MSKIKFHKDIQPNIKSGFVAEILHENEEGYHFLGGDGVVIILNHEDIQGYASVVDRNGIEGKLKEEISRVEKTSEGEEN